MGGGRGAWQKVEGDSAIWHLNVHLYEIIIFVISGFSIGSNPPSPQIHALIFFEYLVCNLPISKFFLVAPEQGEYCYSGRVSAFRILILIQAPSPEVCVMKFFVFAL